MDNGYGILETYRKARGLSWFAFCREMRLRDISDRTIQTLAEKPERRPRAYTARALNAWLARNKEMMEAVIGGRI